MEVTTISERIVDGTTNTLYTENDYIDLIIKYYGLCWIFHILSTVLSLTFFPAYMKKEQTPKRNDKNETKAPTTTLIPTTVADKVNWDYTMASILYCIMIFYFYVMAVMELTPHGLPGRWIMSNMYSTHGITLHIASSLYETTCYLLAKKGIVFYLHHVVTIGGCYSMLFYHRAAYWCCLLGLVEGTNIPLGIVLGGPFRTTPWIKQSLFYKLNGVVLWLMYLLIRIPIPYAMYLLHQDLRQDGLHVGRNMAWVFDNPTHHQYWIYYMDLVGLFLWGLSLLWFTQITNGMIRALGFGGSGGKKRKTS